MATVTFDTHQAVRRLQAAGIELEPCACDRAIGVAAGSRVVIGLTFSVVVSALRDQQAIPFDLVDEPMLAVDSP